MYDAHLLCWYVFSFWVKKEGRKKKGRGRRHGLRFVRVCFVSNRVGRVVAIEMVVVMAVLEYLRVRVSDHVVLFA